MMDGSSFSGDDVNKQTLTSSNGIGQQRNLEVAEIHVANGTNKTPPPIYDVAVKFTSTSDQTEDLPNQCEDRNENRNQNNSKAGNYFMCFNYVQLELFQLNALVYNH